MRTPTLQHFPDPHPGVSPTHIAFNAGATLDFAFDQNYWIDAVGGSALALDLGTNDLGNITSLADAENRGQSALLQRVRDGYCRQAGMK